MPHTTTVKISCADFYVLRENIVSREIVPRPRLVLDSTEQQLGISRTPLNKALARLEIEGQIGIFPCPGTPATNPDAEEIAQCLEVRRVLEVNGIERIVQRFSDQDTRILWMIFQESRDR